MAPKNVLAMQRKCCAIQNAIVITDNNNYTNKLFTFNVLTNKQI